MNFMIDGDSKINIFEVKHSLELATKLKNKEDLSLDQWSLAHFGVQSDLRKLVWT